IGGPIIKDKLHFFVSADIQDKSSAFGSAFNLTGDPTVDVKVTGFKQAQVDQFIQDLKDKNVSGVGDSSAPPIDNPDRNVFGKISWHIDNNNRAEFSYNFVDANLDVLARAPTSPSIPGRLRDGWQLSGSGYTIQNRTNTGRVKVTSSFANGAFSNEFLGGFSIISDERKPPHTPPPLPAHLTPPTPPPRPHHSSP